MRIEIPGKPIAKARARIVRRGNISIAYDPQQKEKEEFKRKLALELVFISLSEDKEIREELHKTFSGEAVELGIESYMPIPKSVTKKKRSGFLGDCIYHNKKPDGDNCFKFVTDCANGILYSDDSKIVKGSFVKKYSANPRTVINIKSINLNGDDL